MLIFFQIEIVRNWHSYHWKAENLIFSMVRISFSEGFYPTKFSMVFDVIKDEHFKKMSLKLQQPHLHPQGLSTRKGQRHQAQQNLQHRTIHFHNKSIQIIELDSLDHSILNSFSWTLTKYIVYVICIYTYIYI